MWAAAGSAPRHIDNTTTANAKPGAAYRPAVCVSWNIRPTCLSQSQYAEQLAACKSNAATGYDTFPSRYRARDATFAPQSVLWCPMTASARVFLSALLVFDLAGFAQAHPHV